MNVCSGDPGTTRTRLDFSELKKEIEDVRAAISSSEGWFEASMLPPVTDERLLMVLGSVTRTLDRMEGFIQSSTAVLAAAETEIQRRTLLGFCEMLSTEAKNLELGKRGYVSATKFAMDLREGILKLCGVDPAEVPEDKPKKNKLVLVKS